MKRIVNYKSVKGFVEYGWRDNPALFVKTAPLEIANRVRYADYLRDRMSRYKYNPRELGSHGLRVDEQNAWKMHYKIEAFEKKTEEIKKDLVRLEKKGLHIILQRRLEFR